MIRPRLFLFAALLLSSAPGAEAAIGAGPSGRISPALARGFAEAPDGRAEMLVVLADQADLSRARAARGKGEKGRRAYEALTAAAARSQRPLLDELARLGAPSRPFWIANFVWTEGDERLARRLAARPDVASVEANPRLTLPALATVRDPVREALLELAPQAVEENLEQVEAPAAWDLGYSGQGIVIGGQDTGYQWDHPALKTSYLGWNGVSVDHDYAWHDAIHSGGVKNCGHDNLVPCDDHGHGTHTMGIAVGDDGGSNQIGVAPGARWIGCRNMDQGVGTPATYSECFQWFVAPTDLNGENPDPQRAPTVVNNSWSCPKSEGCEEPDILRTVVENTRAAGIVVVVSAGNNGKDCSSIAEPASIYDASFTVGAVSGTDAPAAFSGRGPVTVDQSGRLKPDISAPGVFIRSSLPSNAYGALSGTSMAGPHVAGLVALLLSAHPSWIGDVDVIEDAIRVTADHPGTSSQVCGGIPASRFPNNTFGAGRINASEAVRLLFFDGFERHGLARWSVTP